jgi:hypothetical protein
LKEDEFKSEFNTTFGQRKKIFMLRDDLVSKGKRMLHSFHSFHVYLSLHHAHHYIRS